MTIDESQRLDAGDRQPIDISFSGSGGRMIGLGAFNGLMKVLTLGLYGFWAKTEVRRRIWSATRLNGEPLTYTGTGKELFLGFLIVFATVLVPAMIGGVAAMAVGGQRGLSLFQALLYLAFLLLVGNAMYRAQRYRLSRTEWRGIRGALVGSPGAYGWAYFWTLALPAAVVLLAAGAISYLVGPAVGGVIIILGGLLFLWVFPWRANYLQNLMTDDTRFGDRPLTYSGSAGPLYKRYLFAWLGNTLVLALAAGLTGYYLMQDDRYISLVVLKQPPSLNDIATLAAIWLSALIASAVVTSWYRAGQMNHFARHTHFEGATFRGEASGRSLMWLVLSNWLLSIIGLLSGIAVGALLIKLFGPALPMPGNANAQSNRPAIEGMLPLLFVLPPLIVMTTLTTTFAQFRSARYFLSRLKLDGGVDLGAILQSKDKGPSRGEGLAQAFDIDAF